MKSFSQKDVEEWEKEMPYITRYGRQRLNTYVISEANHQKTTQVKRLKVKVAQSSLTLCDPMDLARIPEWVAFPFSRGSFQSRDQTRVSRTTGGFFTS